MKLSAVLLMFVSLAASSSFSIPDRGDAVYDTSGTASVVQAGYAQIQADAGSTVPAGYLVFSFRSGGVLVSEATVPEMRPILRGRSYAAYYGTVNTGVAMVNPNSTDAVVSFYFTPGSTFCDCPNHRAAVLCFRHTLKSRGSSTKRRLAFSSHRLWGP